MCSTCLFQQANKNCCGTVSRAYVFQLCGNSRLGPGRLCMRWVCRSHTMPHFHAMELTRLMLILNKYRDSPMEKAHCSNSFSVVDELLVSGQMHETC